MGQKTGESALFLGGQEVEQASGREAEIYAQLSTPIIHGRFESLI